MLLFLAPDWLFCVLAAAQVVPPESHFGQVDVNDLLSKLISTGIIKPSQPEATPAADTGQSTCPAPQHKRIPKRESAASTLTKCNLCFLRDFIIAEPSAAAPVAPVAAVEEEEEEEQEVEEEEDDIPDLTGFVIDDMKQ